MGPLQLLTIKNILWLGDRIVREMSDMFDLHKEHGAVSKKVPTMFHRLLIMSWQGVLQVFDVAPSVVRHTHLFSI